MEHVNLWKTSITVIILVLSISTSNLSFAQSYANNSNITSQPKTSGNIPPSPSLSDPEKQAIVNAALSVPGLQEWSNQWQYVNMDFIGSTNNGVVVWKYAVVNLELPTINNAPFYCQYGWSAAIKVDLQTKLVVEAYYPTLKNHDCNLIVGGPIRTNNNDSSSSDNMGNSTIHKASPLSPLKQEESGISAKDIQCKQGFVLLIKMENGHPACVKPTSVTRLLSHGWVTVENFEAKIKN